MRRLQLLLQLRLLLRRQANVDRRQPTQTVDQLLSGQLALGAVVPGGQLRQMTRRFREVLGSLFPLRASSLNEGAREGCRSPRPLPLQQGIGLLMFALQQRA